LEIVLLLAFQVLCGSVYHQLGIIVTVFMAGLALGAALANRRGKSGSHASAPAAKPLAFLAFAIAGYAFLLGFLLPLLNRLGNTASSLALIKAVIALLTLVLLAGTLLIPIIGVTGVCLLTAALNLAGGAAALFTKGAPLKTACKND
jgi:hypothetical protein